MFYHLFPGGVEVINKFSKVPLYTQLKNIIMEKIESGEYPEDTKIPSEQELCEMYDISRPTVRQAIIELTNSGILYKMKGKGTFVARSKTMINISDYTGFTDSILDSEKPGQKEIISAQVTEANKRLREVFNIGPASVNAELAEFIYILRENGEVFSLNTSYIPLNLFPNIIEDVKAKKQSFEILSGKYPLVPHKSKSSLEVIYTDQADAQYLLVQPGQPLIKIQNVLYSKNGQPVEFVISKYRADKCRLTFENTK